MTLRGPKPERRRHPRAITSFSATLSAGAVVMQTRVINLSMGGALLAFAAGVALDPIPVGTRLTLNIRFRGGSEPLLVEGRAVLWNRTSGTVPLLAVQFDEVTGDSAEILEDLMLEALSDLRGRQISSARQS
jgi:hypothetical protein